ncbi:sensor histidine kinase [Sphaerospermopsis aphanizomenoides BCCUSP55]|uniref:sensor histidine kinase n=1 Tax=Sphaerospermopsis aphanizomenoides TaxID=459663 RepID=UPI000A6C62FD|nr:sensor histidine kinase [Sphaerospermopsis aphanizomenoides]MBK1990278.1 sensor histidine kinase [Sphaerospermopsis aphanizomenoides BCCUSP55]
MIDLKTYSVKNHVIIGIAISNLVSAGYILLTWSGFTPRFSAIFVLVLNALAITALYQYDQAVKSGLKARQAMLEIIFETIHNGPLQNLDRILKLVREQNLSNKKLIPELEQELDKLNQELQGIYEFWQQETLTQEANLYLGNNIVISLQDPLHEVLYQVYSYTLERDFPCFKTIKIKIRTFEPVPEQGLTIDHKRGICRFLEEALCNVGKYATEVTCLEVTCSSSAGWYTLRIIDNGLGINTSREGRGTKQFKNLATQIQGKFQRLPLSPKGTICELSWPGCLVSYDM